MDLYRVLRISIYLLVASGAFAICVAEGSPAFLVGVFAFGGLAYLTVDSRRMKPVRMEFASAMALALLIYTLLPLREDNGWDRFPAAFAHFLCALQVLLFFTAFRGPMLLLFCGATLAVVVISGVMQPSITLLGRLICFITVTSWTLFIHSLWRARESFQTRSTTQPGETRSAEKVLSERAFWQELALTGGMSATCLVIGVLLYFTAPRLDRLGAWFRPYAPPPSTPKKPHDGSGGIPFGEDPGSQQIITGETTEIQLNIHQQIKPNENIAFKVKFSALPPELADANGRLLFKTGAFAEYRGGTWVESKSSAVKEPEKAILDPSVSGPVFKGAELKESIEECSPGIHAIGVAGEIVRVANVNAQTGPTGVTIDDEGSLSTSNKETLQGADVWVTLPAHEKDLPPKPEAIHGNLSRYVLQTGLEPELESKLRALAVDITGKCGKEDYLAKVQSIAAYLRDPKHFSYTLDLRGVMPAKEPMERFLLNKAPGQNVGHCAFFASAFVLLCRLNNIPARVAKGFAVDLPKSNTLEIAFKHSEAHSWGEVYFKGAGWVAFDPTPHDPNAPTAPPDLAKPDAPPIASAPPKYGKNSGGFIDSNWDWFMNFSSTDQRDAINWVSQELGASGEALGGSMGWIEASIAWTLVLSMLGAIVYLFMKRGGRRLPLIFGGPRKSRAAVAFYNDLLQVLSRRGFVRRPGQTPREFAEWVVKRGGASFQPVLVVTEIFESVRYGNVDVSQDEFNALQKSLDNLRELTFGAGAKN